MRSSRSPCRRRIGGRRAHLRLDGRRFGAVGEHQQPGIADDRCRSDGAAQADMERHHGALAEADQRQRRWRQLKPPELRLDEPLQGGRRLVDADPALVRIAEGQRKPLPADRRLAARLGRVGRHEGGIGQRRLPHPAELDEVVAVGAIAVEEDHELARRPAGMRGQAWAIEFSHRSSWRDGRSSRRNVRACRPGCDGPASPLLFRRERRRDQVAFAFGAAASGAPSRRLAAR